MKIRIGDLTLEQFDKICNERPTCDKCPLKGEAMCLMDEFDLEVEIPDKYFEKGE